MNRIRQFLEESQNELMVEFLEEIHKGIPGKCLPVQISVRFPDGILVEISVVIDVEIPEKP